MNAMNVQMVAVPVVMLARLIEMGNGRVEDVESGIEEGVYVAADNPTLDDDRQMLLDVEALYQAATKPLDLEVVPVVSAGEPLASSSNDDDDGSTIQFTNHYHCPCGEEWVDVWSSACNDKCPDCNREIEPYASDDGSMTSAEIEAARLAVLGD